MEGGQEQEREHGYRRERDYTYLIEAKNITKKFGNFVALRGVNFRVGPNEIVGVVGDNGAGKSTLMKILFGIHTPDTGELYVKGRRFKRLTPKKAYELGIILVHQERTLCPSHHVWRNIFMGREITNSLGFLDIKEMRRISQESLNRLGLTQTSVDVPVRSLSGGYQQGVQISRAIAFEADVVILDEPTNALSLAESQKVLEFVRQIKSKGKSAVMISHNIYHIAPVADRIVILNLGEVVAEFFNRGLTPDDLSHIMLAIAEKGKIPEEYEDINLLNKGEN